MNELLIKLATGQEITDREIANGLFDICDQVHASCDSTCPVYRLNGHKVPKTQGNAWAADYGCDCFKLGTAMLTFIREKHASDRWG